MIPKYILISGKKGHGKSTIAKMIQYQIQRRPALSPVGKQKPGWTWPGRTASGRKFYNIYRLSFADPIKAIGKAIFFLSAEQVGGDDKETPDARWGGLSARQIMQKFGQSMRDIDSDIWARSLIYKARKKEKSLWKGYQPIFVVDDLRFPEEIQLAEKVIGKSEMILVRVERPGHKPGPHSNDISETALDNFSGWDLTLVNDSDLKGLREKVKAFMEIARTAKPTRKKKIINQEDDLAKIST